MEYIYLNPYTDFGFKKLFGEEGNKDLLIDFLNQLLPAHHQISKLNFRNVENLPDTSAERKAIFDIHCVSATGERFVVEMQKAKVKFFKDRALFYSTFPIREQVKKGEWSFELSAVYFVAILDFEYDQEEERRKFRRDITLKDQDGDDFFEKLQFRFLQMPLFNKTEEELETHFDKWIFFLKNLPNFNEIPKVLNEPIFQKAFHTAEIANFSLKQRKKYEQSLKTYWDLKAVIDTAVEEATIKASAEARSAALIEGREKCLAEGRKKGIAEGRKKGLEEGKAKGLKEGKAKGLEEGQKLERLKIAKQLKKNGLSIELIEKATGISAKEIIDL